MTFVKIDTKFSKEFQCFNKAYRDKDSILDQKNEKRTFWDLYNEGLTLRVIDENAY